jgi:transposase
LTKERTEKHEVFRRIIRKQLIMCGYTMAELAVMLHVSLSTAYNKLNNPDSFTYKELQALFYYLKFTPEEQAQAI